MPTDVAMIVTAILVVFFAFAATLAWGDFHSRKTH